jgi:hypothetical protein
MNELHVEPKYSEETYPGATVSTTDPTWLGSGSKAGRCGGKSATNCLSYGTALLTIASWVLENLLSIIDSFLTDTKRNNGPVGGAWECSCGSH